MSSLLKRQEIGESSKGDSFSTGMILLWSGSITGIPSGWSLCDGTNGTPDLRNRFVVGAGDVYAVNDTGGEDSVTLTTAQMPSHSHSGSTESAGGHSHTASTNTTGSHGHSASTGSAGGHSHTGSTNTTGGHTHAFRSTDKGAASTFTGGKFYHDNNGTQTSASMNSAGSHSHSLSINSNGAHTHSVTVNSNGDHSHTVSVDTGGAHSHTVSITDAGGGEAHENRPPFYALAYIMKL